MVTAVVGGTLAGLEGLLLIVLGGLAGLAENPAGEAARTDGVVVLVLGAAVIGASAVARRRPLLLAGVCTAVAAAGFLVDNPLWIFVVPILVAASALAVWSLRGA